MLQGQEPRVSASLPEEPLRYDLEAAIPYEEISW
jgi:hypothetical protein